MDERIETLADLVLRPGSGLHKDVPKRLDESEAMKELRKRLGAVPGGAAVKPSDLVKDNLRSLLDLSLAEDVFARVWNEAKLFQRYLDPDHYPADESIDVTLAKHTVEVKHDPALEIRLEELYIGTIHLSVSASLTVEGAVVSIRDGKILKVASGTVGGHADVKVGELTLLAERMTPITIPGVWEFPKPISIAA